MAQYDEDDIVVWPDGEWSTVGSVANGHYWKSDDYEIVRLGNPRRLRQLGIAKELGITDDGDP